MGKWSLMYLLGSVTSGQQGTKECVDYRLGVLVFENIRKLKKIVNQQVEHVDKMKTLTLHLIAVNDYLKHGYCHHIDKDVEIFMIHGAH